MEFKAKKIAVPLEDPYLNDALERESEVENLSLLLRNISSPIVLSVNAAWGQGKTTFLEMLEANLKKNKCLCVKYSAWETDFAEDPFIAFLGEVNKSLKMLASDDSVKNEALDNVKKAGSHILRKGIPALIKAGTAGIVDAEKLVEAAVSNYTSELSETLIKEYEKNKTAVKDFRKNIMTILENDEGEATKLYIFVDELDRCRPTYAIELLERIKHLLDIEGLVFVLAMDKQQLAHSIKGVYGEGFDALGYLKRFIDIEFVLPHKELQGFIKKLYKDFDFYSFFKKRSQNPAFAYDIDSFNRVIEFLAKANDFSLRDIEQLLSKVNLVFHSTVETEYLHPMLLTFLIAVKTIEPEMYRRYCQAVNSPEEMISYLYSMFNENSRLKSKECLRIEAFLIMAKKNEHDSYLGRSILRHVELINNKEAGNEEFEYSANLKRIVLGSESGYNDVYLQYLIRKIDMLENFNFNVDS